MADTAFQRQYRQEFIATFEQNQSLLRDAVTTEAVIKGNEATFLIAGSGGATAVTRGVNGLIPARADDLTQTTATLAEWHDLVRKTKFNVFASQGNQRAIMQKTSMGVVNRKIDQDILSGLSAATVTAGSAVKASLGLALKAKTILGNSDVPWDNNLFAIISPAFDAYLLQIKEYSSAEYVNSKPIPGAENAWDDRPKMKYWIGVNWIVHPNLVGAGTASETCYMFHKSAIGHAADTEGLESLVGYDEEQAYSWARTSIHMGAKLLQNSGVVKILHDGSEYVGS